MPKRKLENSKHTRTVLRLVRRRITGRMQGGRSRRGDCLWGWCTTRSTTATGGAKSFFFTHSSSLINPLRASCSLPVHASRKSSRPRRFTASDRDITMRNDFGHQNALRVSGLLLVLTAHPRRPLRPSILAREFSSTVLNECPSLRASARSRPTKFLHHLILSVFRDSALISRNVPAEQ